MILTSTMNTTTTTTTTDTTTTTTTATTSTTNHNYVNISGLQPINDPYFRYKMPLPHILQNSTLNKTILSNLSDLVSTLHSCRSKPCPEEVMKFLSLDLATRTHCDYNSSSSSSSCLPEQGLVCGNFTKLQVQNSINKYIEFFILCPRCRCPETQHRKKKGRIFLDCVGGCGALEEVEIDNHCFCRYILSHCADEFVVEEEEEEEDDENGRKKRGCGGRRGKSHKRKHHHHHHHRHSGTQKSKERHHHVDNNNNNNNNDEAVEDELLDVTTTVESSSEDEIETASDATAAAEDQQQQQQQQQDAIENLQSFLQRYPNASTEDILNILQTTTTTTSSSEEEEEASSCRQQIQVLIQAAFQNNTNTNTYCRQQQQQSLFHHTNQSIQRLTPVLSSLTNSVPSLERCLISALEVLLSTQPPPPPPQQEQTQTCTITSSSSSSFSSIPKSFFPVMLKQLYEQDVLKEDVILSWASQEERSEEYTEDCVDEVSRCELRRYAEEFVVWLREAEEESSTEEESGCEEEEEEEECAAPSTTTTTASCSPVRSSIFGNISWCDTSLEDTDDDYLLQNNDDDNNDNNNSSRRRRRVHFSTVEVSGIREIPRIQNMDEWSSCFYTGHEMQRMADDARREQQQQQQQQQQLQVGF